MQLFLLSFLSFHKIAISFKIFFHCSNVILTDECIQICRWLLVTRLTNFCDLLHLLLCLDSFRVYTKRYCRTMSIFADWDKISNNNYSFFYSLNIFKAMMIDIPYFEVNNTSLIKRYKTDIILQSNAIFMTILEIWMSHFQQCLQEFKTNWPPIDTINYNRTTH